VVVRDGKREVLATLVVPKDYIIEPNIAKTAATLSVIKLSREWSNWCMNIIELSDWCMNMITHLPFLLL
jgi:hypothetical protein